MKKAILSVVLFILVLTMAGSGFWMVRYYMDSREQKEKFQKLSQETAITAEKPQYSPIASFISGLLPAEEKKEEPTEKPMETLHDVAALQRRNPDCVGWISVPGTGIDYPLMWTPGEPEKYLRLDFEGCYSDYGTPFLDGRSSLSQGNLLLYAHNMFDGSMFTPLIHFPDEEYAREHSRIVLETAEGVKEYRVFAVLKTTADSPVYTTSPEELLEAVQSESVLTLEQLSLEQPSGREFILLSTCDVSRNNGRIAVVGYRKDGDAK